MSLSTPVSQNAIYKCKKCGRRMTLRDAANYFGIPACPVCVHADAPFDGIVEESPDAGFAEGQRAIPPNI